MGEKNESGKKSLEEIDNTALVRAMQVMKAKGGVEAEKAFLNELVKAVFISPANVEEKDGEKRVQFSVVNDGKGGFLLPAFTSVAEAEKYPQETGMRNMACNLEQYVNMITAKADGPKALVIDPYGENILIPKMVLERFKAKASEDPDKIKLGDLREHPVGMENVLKDFFEEEGTVEKAYLLPMKRGGDVSLLLIVDNRFPEGVSEEELKKLRKELYDRISKKVIQEYEKYKSSKPEYKDLGFLIVDFHAELGSKAANGRQPFYTA